MARSAGNVLQRGADAIGRKRRVDAFRLMADDGDDAFGGGDGQGCSHDVLDQG
jgi:hypothetical protein